MIPVPTAGSERAHPNTFLPPVGSGGTVSKHTNRRRDGGVRGGHRDTKLKEDTELTLPVGAGRLSPIQGTKQS